MREQEVVIFSLKHNRTVFCSKTGYYERYSGTHLNTYYTELTAQGQLMERKVRLPLDSEEVTWFLCTQSEI